MGELYYIKPKPVIYNGIQMRSMLEMQTARALDAIGIDWAYETTRFADEDELFTPDFEINDIAVMGAPGFDRVSVFVEVRPSDNEAHRKKADRNAITLALSTPRNDLLLLFVGFAEWHAALFGWCYRVEEEGPVLGVLGVWRKQRLDRTVGTPEPCLYVKDAASIWLDGFMTRDKT